MSPSPAREWGRSTRTGSSGASYPEEDCVAGFGAGRLLLGRRFDVASVHDPELLPLALLAALFGRTIVFDVHENVPAQLRTKPWLPRPVRSPLASIFGWLFHVAEKHMAITLAESGYQELFRRPHPVFPNYLIGAPPDPRAADATSASCIWVM